MNRKIIFTLLKKELTDIFKTMCGEHGIMSSPDECFGFMHELPEKYRLPVMMFYFEDMAVADIAKAVDLPEGTVISRLHRGRARLREELKDYE